MHARVSAGSEQRQGLAAERLDNVRGVDATPAGGVGAIENVCAVFEYEFVNRDRAINRGING